MEHFSACIKVFSCNREHPVQYTKNPCEFPVTPVKICSVGKGSGAKAATNDFKSYLPLVGAYN